MIKLDFFKTNAALKTEKIRIRKPSPSQTLFANTVLEVFSPTVREFGFVRQRTEVGENMTAVVFQRAGQYIKIIGSTYPRDYPYYFNILFGKCDSDDFSDREAIALWRFKLKIDPDAKVADYEFPFGENVKSSVCTVNGEFLKYAESFLHGELSLFNELVSEQNMQMGTLKT